MFEADKICNSMSVFTVVHYENCMIIHIPCYLLLSSLPGLPNFYSPCTFKIMHRNRRVAKLIWPLKLSTYTQENRYPIQSLVLVHSANFTLTILMANFPFFPTLPFLCIVFECIGKVKFYVTNTYICTYIHARIDTQFTALC